MSGIRGFGSFLRTSAKVFFGTKEPKKTVSEGSEKLLEIFKNNPRPKNIVQHSAIAAKPLELAKRKIIEPFLPWAKKVNWLGPRSNLTISGDDFVLERLDVNLGSGGESRVDLGLMFKNGKVFPVAVLTNKVSTRYFNFLKGAEGDTEVQRSISQINQGERALSPLRNHPHLDLRFHMAPTFTGTEIVRAKEVALSSLFDGMKGEMNAVKFLEVIRDVVDGLDAMHKSGIVHGDIKAENILFNISNDKKSYTGMITDFSGAGRVGVPIKISTERYVPDDRPRNMQGDSILHPTLDMFAVGRLLVEGFGEKTEKWLEKGNDQQKQFVDKVLDFGIEIIQSDYQSRISAGDAKAQLDSLVKEASSLNFPKLGNSNLRDVFLPANLNW